MPNTGCIFVIDHTASLFAGNNYIQLDVLKTPDAERQPSSYRLSQNLDVGSASAQGSSESKLNFLAMVSK
jgi:hypothetical protein